MAKVTDLVATEDELAAYPPETDWGALVQDNWKALDQLEDELEALGYEVLPRLTLDGGAVGDLIPLDDEDDGWNVLDDGVATTWTDDWSDEWVGVPPPATTRR